MGRRGADGGFGNLLGGVGLLVLYDLAAAATDAGTVTESNVMGEKPEEIDLRAATPSQIAGRDLPRADMVTSVIEHEVKPGFEPKYEEWLKKITPIAGRFPGHQGITIIRPTVGSRRYTLLLRFATLEHAQDWFQSTARKTLIAEVEPYLTSGENVELKTGLEFWFKPPAGKAAPSAFKQSIVTLIVLYPLTLIVPGLWNMMAKVVPPLGNPFVSNLFVDAIIVGLLTYLLMPRATHLVRRWLYV
jgi:antibiotic biosynthesis monooxygenase (ABM) superfamily enzyme